MKKLLTKIENSKSFWFLLIATVIFFILRLPSLIEPHWYGDEGIYQVIGIAINDGRLLYSQIFDNKPPLLYTTYALFDSNQFHVRLLSLFTGIIAISSFFYLCRSVFRNLKSSIMASSLFVILFGLPVLEGNIANAENFMLPFVITAALIVYKLANNKNQKITNSNQLFLGGLLLGLAFLFKTVAIFDFGAFLIFMLIVNLPTKLPKNKMVDVVKKAIKKLLPFISGFLLPLSITIIYFAANNALSDFIKATLVSNINYVGWKNALLIPQGFLIFKLLLLSILVYITYSKRGSLSKPLIFSTLWLGFSMFSVFFSGRPYTHYALLGLPAFLILFGLIVSTKETKIRPYLVLFFAIIILIIGSTFKPNFKKSLDYYQNAFMFLTNQKSVESYKSFFDQKTPRDYIISSFIRQHSRPDDSIFIWGDSAQIYALSDKTPPGRYTVSYHIKQYPNALRETQIAIFKKRPKYIVILKESSMFPFALSNYSLVFSFEGTDIYERNN